MTERVRNDGFRFIKAIGVEIECGTRNIAKLEKIVEDHLALLAFDGSVHVPMDHPSIEIKRKFMVNSELKKLKSLAEAVFGVAVQNETCGNHFHVSLKNQATQVMASREFMSAFMKRYKKEYAGDEKYLARLKNRYCRGVVSEARIERQLRYDEGARYTAINACSFPKIGTVEFRMMPHAADAKEYLSQAKFVLKTVEAILAKTEKVYRTKLEMPSDEKISGEFFFDKIVVESDIEKTEVMACAS